ncbi:hypothetical protein F0562_022982 [Nyssa sinensis]|uniref:Thionin-like protein 2 n=1 Tax=Nyssa sinensis TaxID=561372 RepID=A0A5J5BHS9_9ASTE|nr:hypothetical protein F0562_022982 [Nyssa sinensis]
MQGEKLRALVGVVMLLGMLLGQSTASFKDCYVECFIFCMIKPSNSAFSCSIQCLKDCIIPKSPQDIHATHIHDYCKLGCASSLCSNISTKQSPDGEKVESCVGSCSELCTKN